MIMKLVDYQVEMIKPLEKVLPKTLQHFQRRETIPHNPNTIWQIEAGVVRTATWELDGSIVPLGFWGVGDIIGSPLSQINPYQIDCLTDVTVCILPNQSPYPFKAMLSHIHQIEELLRMMHGCSIEQRLLRFLHWFADKFGEKTGEGRVIKIRLTHQEIAEVIGSTRVTVTRMLQKFQSERMLGWSEERYMLLGYSASDLG
jgi:CRP-like cAMP-binding protein